MLYKVYQTPLSNNDHLLKSILYLDESCQAVGELNFVSNNIKAWTESSFSLLDFNSCKHVRVLYI